MELDICPRLSPGGSLHLLSPPHGHGSAVDGFSAIRQIRRSLSRSPSKPSRYGCYSHVGAHGPPVPTPRSPSTLHRSHSAENTTAERLALVIPTHRQGVTRPRPRKVSPTSPLRRALGDNPNQINALLPRMAPRRHGEDDQENMDCSDDTAKPSPMSPFADERSAGLGRILSPVRRELASPMKSSPLKRSDRVMNLETATFGSPRSSKRRSLQSPSKVDFNIFEQSFNDVLENATPSSSQEDSRDDAPFTPTSPQRRPFGLRRSTLQQRTAPARRVPMLDTAREVPSGPATTSRVRARFSLDGALPLRGFDPDSPFRKPALPTSALSLFAQPLPPPVQATPRPHPLSKTLTPSSAASSVAESHTPATALPAAPMADVNTSAAPIRPPAFSKSLPIGAMRPPQPPSNDSFETPAAFKMAKPLPQAFMSTGLISKRNRHVDIAPTALFASVNMPDTPSKKAPPMHLSDTPSTAGALKTSQPQQEFGSPGTPFSRRRTVGSNEAWGRGLSIFGAKMEHAPLSRSASFVSTDGDETSNSPLKAMSSFLADDLPPTPTKSTSMAIAPLFKGKSSSLRSSLFGRRPSVLPDTFSAPSREPTPATGEDQDDETSTSLARVDRTDTSSPHTPQLGFTPPDASALSVSLERRGSGLFNSHSFPPATPTAPRTDAFNVSVGGAAASTSYFANDVDTAMTSRFGLVTSIGAGEFSQVYKVENAVPGRAAAPTSSGPGSNVWAVKKSRRPYTGVRDRMRKMQEVQILQALRGHEHVVEYVDHWEAKNHLYLQTEFCENGNLKDFLLQTGFKGRLDDFRIWKIMLELAQGVQAIHAAGYIHLDLKPANVFIDWEGVLKIGDFGLASSWPAPAGLDGEGDREYIGPEVLSGRFDKPADIFSLGMILLEIAGNIVLPDNGTSWQRLRNGDLSDLPSLTSERSLLRDEQGEVVEPLTPLLGAPAAVETADDDDDLAFLRPARPKSAVNSPRLGSGPTFSPPAFMTDPTHPESLDNVVHWLISPDPDARPAIADVLAVGPVYWVEARRRAGATVYEGNFGPAVTDGEISFAVPTTVAGDIEMTDI